MLPWEKHGKGEQEQANAVVEVKAHEQPLEPDGHLSKDGYGSRREDDCILMPNMISAKVHSIITARRRGPFVEMVGNAHGDPDSRGMLSTVDKWRSRSRYGDNHRKWQSASPDSEEERPDYTQTAPFSREKTVYLHTRPVQG